MRSGSEQVPHTTTHTGRPPKGSVPPRRGESFSFITQLWVNLRSWMIHTIASVYQAIDLEIMDPASVS